MVYYIQQLVDFEEYCRRYMAAGLGQKTGREALSALNDEIVKIDTALEQLK